MCSQDIYISCSKKPLARASYIWIMEGTFFVRQLHSLRESYAINGPKLRGLSKGKICARWCKSGLLSRNSARHQPAAVCARSWNENVPCSLSHSERRMLWLGRPGVTGHTRGRRFYFGRVTAARGLTDECGARVLWAFYERFRWRAGRVIIKYYHTYVRGTSLSIYGLCCLRLRALRVKTHCMRRRRVALSIFVCLPFGILWFCERAFKWVVLSQLCIYSFFLSRHMIAFLRPQFLQRWGII